MKTIKGQTYNPLRRMEQTWECRHCGEGLRPCNHRRHEQACKRRLNEKKRPATTG
jgi:hypothetical protein